MLIVECHPFHTSLDQRNVAIILLPSSLHPNFRKEHSVHLFLYTVFFVFKVKHMNLLVKSNNWLLVSRDWTHGDELQTVPFGTYEFHRNLAAKGSSLHCRPKRLQ